MKQEIRTCGPKIWNTMKMYKSQAEKLKGCKVKRQKYWRWWQRMLVNIVARVDGGTGGGEDL